MTKNAKVILIAATGGGLLIGFLLLCVAVIAAVGFISASSAGPDGPTRRSAVKSKKAPDAPQGSLAPELAGTWINRSGGGSVDYTGKTQYRSGRVTTYRIAADGSVEYFVEKDVLTILQCEIKERRTAGGKAATAAGTLTVNLGESDFTASNSCEDGGETTARTLPAETVKLDYRIDEEFGAPRLCLDEAEGELCYDKEE
jgi:hypothetical protein